MMGRSPVISALAALAILSASSAFAREALSDAQVRDTIVKESVARYLATGHPCACPYNLARNGSSCGSRSASAGPAARRRSVTPKTLVTGWLPIGRGRTLKPHRPPRQ